MSISRTRAIEEILYGNPLSEFPFHTLFTPPQGGFSFVDPQFSQVERIGGTVTYLENELKSQLLAFRQLPPVNNASCDFAKHLGMIFAIGVVPQVSQFIRLLEKIYVNQRSLSDTTEQGR
jgi:hypothetical protein